MLLNETLNALTFGLYSAAFFMLGSGVLSFADERLEHPFSRHTRLLAAFAVGRGVAAILAAEAARGAALGWLILLLLLLAYVCQFEYGRRLWNDTRGGTVHLGAWIYLVPAAFLSWILTGVGDLQAGLDAALRFVLNLPAALLCAVVFIATARNWRGRQPRVGVELYLVAGSYAAFGLLNCLVVLPLVEFPSLPSNADFRRVMGFPVQGAHTAVILVLTMSYLSLLRKAARHAIDRSVRIELLQRNEARLQELVEQRTRELAEARTNAERASLAKSQFLSHMSHEFRTPLNAIIGFGELVEQDPDLPRHTELHSHIREIVHAGDHLLALVNDLLDLGRIESGNLQLDIQTLALQPLLEQCVRQLRPLIERRGLQVHMDCAADSFVRADGTRLTQVVLNLLANAVKYNVERGSIALRCERMPDMVRVSITDSGRGLGEAEIAALFRPFERLDAGDSAIEGTGIGLVLCKYLIEAMGGSIGVVGSAGQGSTFWFELPASPPPHEDRCIYDATIVCTNRC